MAKNIVALDIGDKRIGIAATDALGMMAHPLETYHRTSFNADIDYICGAIKARGAELVVCGLPKHFDGRIGEQAIKTRTFIDALREKLEIEVVEFDERFSTLEARRVLIEADMRRDKRKNVIDKIAACYILEDYLNKNK